MFEHTHINSKDILRFSFSRVNWKQPKMSKNHTNSDPRAQVFFLHVLMLFVFTSSKTIEWRLLVESWKDEQEQTTSETPKMLIMSKTRRFSWYERANVEFSNVINFWLQFNYHQGINIEEIFSISSPFRMHSILFPLNVCRMSGKFYDSFCVCEHMKHVWTLSKHVLNTEREIDSFFGFLRQSSTFRKEM